MMTIGLTGGIGSGKSYVCHLFELLGAVIYNADKEAKEVMVNDLKLVSSIKKVFGEDAYNNDGTLNRTYLSNIIFTDNMKRNQLNSLVHPALQNHFLAFANECRENNIKIVVIEAAVLIESGFHKIVDKIVVVSADYELRVQRTIKRDGVTEEQVVNRISSQMKDSEREKYADYWIVNNEKELLLPQIVSILEKI